MLFLFFHMITLRLRYLLHIELEKVCFVFVWLLYLWFFTFFSPNLHSWHYLLPGLLSKLLYFFLKWDKWGLIMNSSSPSLNYLLYLHPFSSPFLYIKKELSPILPYRYLLCICHQFQSSASFYRFLIHQFSPTFRSF